MRQSHLALMAAAVASLGAAPMPSAPRRVEAKAEPDGEKVSRQRKRWLERQARKQQRKNKTTRRG